MVAVGGRSKTTCVHDRQAGKRTGRKRKKRKGERKTTRDSDNIFFMEYGSTPEYLANTLRPWSGRP